MLREQEFLYAAEHGSVLVSPCISRSEKRIAHAALKQRYPLIVLLPNGIPPHYKPSDLYFDACARGDLLMLAPLPCNKKPTTITRKQCLCLNDWAAAVTDTGRRNHD
jgi:hypothetical protein